MKLMTFIWLLVAAATGIGVLLLKHDVERLEADLARHNAAIEADQQAIHVLKAEWSYLNDPVRLRDLAQKHLGLDMLGPDRITSFADLPMRDERAPGPAPASALPGAATAAPPEDSLADGTAARSGQPDTAALPPDRAQAPKVDRIGLKLQELLDEEARR